jgi:hypothetical protein
LDGNQLGSQWRILSAHYLRRAGDRIPPFAHEYFVVPSFDLPVRALRKCRSPQGFSGRKIEDRVMPWTMKDAAFDQAINEQRMITSAMRAYGEYLLAGHNMEDLLLAEVPSRSVLEFGWRSPKRFSGEKRVKRDSRMFAAS